MYVYIVMAVWLSANIAQTLTVCEKMTHIIQLCRNVLAWQHLVLESVAHCCMHTCGCKVTAQFVLANSDISGNDWTILNMYAFWSSSSNHKVTCTIDGCSLFYWYYSREYCFTLYAHLVNLYIVFKPQTYTKFLTISWHFIFVAKWIVCF